MARTVRFLCLWSLAFLGFIVVRLLLGQTLDAQAAIAGVFIQLVLVALLMGCLSLAKRLNATYRNSDG